MPKKQVRNAFYCFMKELEPQLRREGRVFPNGMADIVPIAHPRWKDLPQKEKDRFEKMAKDYKARMRGQDGDKVRQDNQGKILAYRKDPYTELEKRRMNEKKDIRKNWPPGKDLANEPFYFINFQTLCVTEEGEYLPCEIAVIEYSLANGITKQLHRFIQPGKIPSGYRFTCQENSKDTHQIPIENFDLADSNYRGLWIQLENFINPNGERDEYPPLYCLGTKDDYKIVEYCLDWIHGRTCIGGPNRLRKVYEIESLFQEMHAHIGQVASKTNCIDMLTSSEWDYQSGSRCDYHEELEVKFCSLGTVRRYAYAVSDRLCESYDVKLTPNHIPMKPNDSNITVLSPSSMPVCTKQESRLPPKSEALHFKPKTGKREPVQEDYGELRKPYIPGEISSHGRAWAGDMSAATGGPADHPVMGGVKAPGAAWAGQMGGPAGDFYGRGRGMSVGLEEDFPTLSISDRGTSLQQPFGIGRGLMAQPVSYAGRGAPVQPPQYPPSVNNVQQMSAPLQPPMGIARGRVVPGLPTDNGDSLAGMRIPGQFSSDMFSQQGHPTPDLTPLRMPGQSPVSNQFRNAEPEPQTSRVAHLTGRGRGAILDDVLKKGIKPKGRGYAPPDWVDDGSIPVHR